MIDKGPRKATPSAHVYGCSHSMFFHTTGDARVRLADLCDVPPVAGEVIIGASVAGFRPRASTLNTKEIVTRGAHEAQRLVLAFGQVDLELGYYYRKVIKGEDIEIVSFLRRLARDYLAFVEALPIARSRIALKGVNLTVLENPQFTFKYTRRIINEEKSELAPKTPKAKRRMKRRLERAILPAQVQNAMHIGFNALIEAWCVQNGARYFDINSEIARVGQDGQPDPYLGLDPRFAPSGFDHHLTDSLEVRAIHARALARAFAADASDMQIAAE